jgi:uncharacterized protein
MVSVASPCIFALILVEFLNCFIHQFVSQYAGCLDMNREELLDQVKRAVRAVEPGAEIILYGSRSRGEAVSESDWDFLILVSGHLDDKRVDTIRHRLYEVEWECGEVISSIVRSREEWHSSLYQSIPFHQRVEQEGIRL